MDASKNRGTPKWMVKIMENPIKMDDLGVPLFFFETPIFFGQVKGCYFFPDTPWDERYIHLHLSYILSHTWSSKRVLL